MKYYLAVDIGASSGRHLLGWNEGGHVMTKEVYRFPNGVKESGGHLTWDIESLVSHVKHGIDEALKVSPEIVSLSVDTWGVDYVLMKGDSEVLPCYAYRDTRTYDAINEVHNIIPFEDRHTASELQHNLPALRGQTCRKARRRY